MTTDQITIFAILGVTLILFAVNRWRYDVVAVLALVVSALAGIVPHDRVFFGFGTMAVATVAAVLIISQALKNSGVVDYIAARLTPFTRHPIAHILALTVVVTVASAFMNNVGALALMLPVALATAAEHERSPALLLMPLAFGSLLGGMMTMIGTPPNIIVANYRGQISGEPFGMFDYTPVGLVIALAGLLFITLLGWRLIPKERRGQNTTEALFATDKYLTEVRLLDDSPLIGRPLADLHDLAEDDLDVIGLARGRGRSILYSPKHALRAGDVLLLRAEPKRMKKLIDDNGLELLTSATPAFYELTSGELTLLEAAVPPNSALVGRDLTYLRRRTGNTVALVALARQGEPVRRRLAKTIYAPGDVLLLQGEAETVNDSIAQLGLLPLAGRYLRLGRPRRLLTAVAIFAAAITAGALGWVPITLALMLAILAYLLLGILPMRELYSAVDWSIIVLLGAMIPVGQALETTGATLLIAQSMTAVIGELPIWFILAAIMVITMFLSDIVNNAATAVVMAPIAARVATELGASADPFLMCVAVGASSAFLTPIGHQSNTLVMGPAGYRFTDYWRMGLPLEALIVAVGVPAIMAVWPP